MDEVQKEPENQTLEAPPTQNLNQAKPADTQPVKPKRKLPLPKILVAGIVILITLLAFGLFAYLVMGQNKAQENQITETQVSAPTPTPDPITKWETFKGDGFSFKYPSSISLEEKDNYVFLNHKIYFVNELTNRSLLDCRGDCPVGENVQEIQINNYQAKRIDGYIGSIGGNIPQTFITYEITDPESENLFSISLYELPQDDTFADVSELYTWDREPQPIDNVGVEEFQQILSTFKFTDKESETTKVMNSSELNNITWKTYEENGYSFDYPNIGILNTTSNEVSYVLMGPTQQQETEFYDGVNIQISSGSLNGQSLVDFVNSQAQSTIKSGVGTILEQPKFIIINNIQAITYKARGLGEFTYIYVPSVNDEYLLLINGTVDPTEIGFEKITDQIISSFRLTE